MRVAKPGLYLLSSTDCNTPHLHEKAKLFQDAKNATLGEVGGIASLGLLEHVDSAAVSQSITTAYQQREHP